MAAILVIDDDVPVCNSFKALLSEYDHDVEILSDPTETPNILKKASFDLAIIDIYMPKTDGLETIRLLRETHPEITIIAMSGKKREPFNPLSAAEAYGAKLTISKPISAKQLLEVVDQALLS
ncbi:MAG: response regulator [Alphaproteobacteria bacterium]|nr:response regulator [Rhodospirillales bacterium]MCW9045487.1 response regulator [Alphaproteobacteria bacterium]